MTFNCRRSDDGNFLLGSFTVAAPDGGEGLRSDLRIGWDPVAGEPRGWVFDSDGGFGEWHWATDGSNWVVRSTLTLPDGLTAAATLYLEPAGPDRFTWRTLDRVIGGAVQPAAEATMVRTPPEPSR